MSITPQSNISNISASSYPVSTDEHGVKRVFTGTPWEPIAGYCRAIRKGNHIFVSGTTATDIDTTIGIGDPEAQMRFIMEKVENSLISLGGSLEDVVRTRIFIKNIADCEAIVRVHGEVFKNKEPANTTIQANLIGDEYLLEVEVEAIVI